MGGLCFESACLSERYEQHDQCGLARYMGYNKIFYGQVSGNGPHDHG
jgi:hypothetical protein